MIIFLEKSQGKAPVRALSCFVLEFSVKNIIILFRLSHIVLRSVCFFVNHTKYLFCGGLSPLQLGVAKLRKTQYFVCFMSLTVRSWLSFCFGLYYFPGLTNNKIRHSKKRIEVRLSCAKGMLISCLVTQTEKSEPWQILLYLLWFKCARLLIKPCTFCLFLSCGCAWCFFVSEVLAKKVSDFFFSLIMIRYPLD